jgi:choline dehydrogenase-like flavoprotein
MQKSVCVIGAGLAGGIVAATLAARGHPVTLLELGDAPAPLQPADEVWENLGVQAPFTRGSGLGGTSNLWHGGLTILDRTDVEGVAAGQGERAPLAYAELRRYYEQAIGLVREASAFSLAQIESTPDAPVDGFGVARDAFRLKALLYPDTPFSSRPLIRRADELHRLQIVSDFEVLRLASAGSRRVTYAQGVERRTGKRKDISADIFVVCAGGLGSPKILLRSTEACPALANLPVGRYLIDHPSGFVFKAQLRRRMDLAPLFGLRRQGYKLRYGFALRADRLGEADSRNHILYLRPAISMKDPSAYDFLKRKLVAGRGRSVSPLDFAQLLRHPDLLFDAVNFRYGILHSTRYVSGLVFAEQTPDRNERLHQRDDGKIGVNWTFSAQDRRSLEKFLAAFGETFAQQFASFTLFPDIGPKLDSSGHHSGACRMAANASHGVVDADLRVFGVDNLFVADGSTLPYSGHANTGLTIAALALKCCDAVAKV